MPQEPLTIITELREALKSDPGLYESWQANIAMCQLDAIDHYKRSRNKAVLNRTELHTCANNGAQNFLNLLIS